MASEKKKVSTFHVDSRLIETVDKLAEESERSRSAVIRIALKEYVRREIDAKDSSSGHDES